MDEDGNALEHACFDVKSLWPDNSIKWLGLRSYHTLDVKQEASFHIAKRAENQTFVDSSIVEHTATLLNIRAGNQTITLKKASLLTLSTPDFSSHGVNIIDGKGTRLEIGEVTTSYSVAKNHERNMFVDVQQQASVVCVNDDRKVVLELSANVSIGLLFGDIQCEITIRNPQAASHENGQWDLGDINSLLLQEISWLISSADNQTCKLHLDKATQELTVTPNIVAYQASSGFANWRSAIHVNKDNQVDLPFAGYRIEKNGTLLSEGEQLSPLVGLSDNVALKIEDFWQNFPSSIETNREHLSISLLGSRFCPITELQPGEQKTRKLEISCPKNLHANLKIQLAPEYVLSTQSIFACLSSSMNQSFLTLINQGLEGEDSFYEKQRVSDSFGWRHFGELHADHESALEENPIDFVSHYNNQYDPIHGFLIQWLKTGDYRWFELADKLAKHVADIDVYHTELDKPDYNGGLFWHTDHYVQAYTATHRTYSKHQPKNVYNDHAGGGGPGGQHCYTQGLTLHYLLTGYMPSKTASLKLSKWIETLYEGDNTLVALALGIKNRHRVDLKSVLTGKYPLDRGTGNYIQALLDRYELTGKMSIIAQVGRIVCNTVSSNDVIEARDLKNIEETWFYTVFLQSVCRFLTILKQINSVDSATLAHQVILSVSPYFKWIVEHEYLALDKPEILEFANQTWSAQDLRKVCILAFMSPFINDTTKSKAQNKRTEFESNIIERLKRSPESKTTRVMCLMMQNCHIDDFAQAGTQVHQWLSESESTQHYQHSMDSVFSVLLTTLSTLSMEKERKSAVLRFPPLRRWLGEP